jgi:3-methyl-2-oxobutanoate hydroxymethyltransferase
MNPGGDALPRGQADQQVGPTGVRGENTIVGPLQDTEMRLHCSSLDFPLVAPRFNRNRSAMTREKVTPDEIRAMKRRGEKIASLTVYDYPITKLVDETGVPLLLVGDSLGMVVLGYPDTTHVTMAEMEHHVRAAARARPRSLLAADLPFRSYETPADAVAHARRLVAAGAEAVKAEGGRSILGPVRAVIDAGIPFIGHLGMLPQHVLEEGGYHIKGKTDAEREALLADARALAEAGAFAIVLELVTPPVAKVITASVPVPTIGIGSGPDCDGQILVTPDLVGTFPWFTPRFVKPRLNAAEQMREAIAAWQASL